MSKREKAYLAISIISFDVVLYLGVIYLVDLVEAIGIGVIWLGDFAKLWMMDYIVMMI